VRVFQLRARLAEEDSEDRGTADEWLERAAAADADAQWVCNDCGTVADEWSAVCGNCGAFGTLAWNQPPRIHRAVMSPPVTDGSANMVHKNTAPLGGRAGTPLPG